MSRSLSQIEPFVLARALVRAPVAPVALQEVPAAPARAARPRRFLPPCACCAGPARSRVGSASLAGFLGVAVGDRVCSACVAVPLTN